MTGAGVAKISGTTVIAGEGAGTLAAVVLSAVVVDFSRAIGVLGAGVVPRLGVAAARIRLVTGKALPGVAAGIVTVAGGVVGATADTTGVGAGACCASNVDAKLAGGFSEAPESRFVAGLTRSANVSAIGVVLFAEAGAAIETVMKQGLPACGKDG